MRIPLVNIQLGIKIINLDYVLVKMLAKRLNTEHVVNERENSPHLIENGKRQTANGKHVLITDNIISCNAMQCTAM